MSESFEPLFGAIDLHELLIQEVSLDLLYEAECAKRTKKCDLINL